MYNKSYITNIQQNMEKKNCTKCNKLLPLSDYYVVKKTGYRYSYCKKCHYHRMTKHTAKKWRENNPERWSADVYKAQRSMFRRDKQGVYLLITDKGMYIGQTDKYKHRLWQHRNSHFKGNMLHKDAKIVYATLLIEEKDRAKRLELEKYWINKLRPALNKLHNPDYGKKK